VPPGQTGARFVEGNVPLKREAPPASGVSRAAGPQPGHAAQRALLKGADRRAGVFGDQAADEAGTSAASGVGWSSS
jgi:hypothetical protein